MLCKQLLWVRHGGVYKSPILKGCAQREGRPGIFIQKVEVYRTLVALIIIRNILVIAKALIKCHVTGTVSQSAPFRAVALVVARFLTSTGYFPQVVYH